MISALASLTLALALVSQVQAQAGSTVAQKVAALRAAPGQNERFALLEDSELVFNFLNPPGGVSKGAAGTTTIASVQTFPYLVGHGMAMTVGYLEACGYNIPHTHPRATEFNIAVNGTLVTGILGENGARFILNEVPAGSATVFPKGAIHFEMNNGCEPMIFVAAFNHEDPGTLAIAQRFLGINLDYAAAALGGDIGIQELAQLESKIPNNIALGTDECLRRCGIQRTAQPDSQRQPRISANALPPGYSGPASVPHAAAATPPAAATPSPSVANQLQSPPPMPTMVNSPPAAAPPPAASSSAQAFVGGAAVTAYDLPTRGPDPTLIALIVVVSILGIGYAVLGVVFFMRRSKRNAPNGRQYFMTGAQYAPSGMGGGRMPFESYGARGSTEKFRDSPPQTPYDPPHDRQ